MRPADPPSPRRTALAGLWNTAEVLTRQVAQFAVAVVLARLLSPSAFGLAALVMFFVNFAQNVLQGGLNTAIVQRARTSYAEENALFWLNLLCSACLALALLLGSGAVARFFGQEALRPLLAAAALTMVVNALGSVHAALLARALAFDRLMWVAVAATTCSGIAGIGAAMAGAGAWALVLMALVAAAANSAALWVASDWRPARPERVPGVSGLVRFAGWVSLASAIDVLYTQGNSLLVGKLFGLRELGLFNRAASTQALPSSLFTTAVSRLALPLLSARAGDPAALRAAARTAIRLAMMVNLPVMLVLSLLARPAITTLFGAQWAPAAPVLAVLALSGVLLPLHVINLQVLMALGELGLFFRRELLKKAAGIACICAGAAFGIMGLAWGQVAASLIAFVINAASADRTIGYPWHRQLRDLGGLAAPTAAMGLAVAAMAGHVDDADPVRLAGGSLAGLVIYAAVGLLFRAAPFVTALELVRSGEKRAAPGGTGHGSD